jgi:hypothetical protein
LTAYVAEVGIDAAWNTPGFQELAIMIDARHKGDDASRGGGTLVLAKSIYDLVDFVSNKLGLTMNRSDCTRQRKENRLTVADNIVYLAQRKTFSLLCLLYIKVRSVTYMRIKLCSNNSCSYLFWGGKVMRWLPLERENIT